jgi:comEA protein
MFSLTSYERKVLIFIAILILCGATLRFLNVKYHKASYASAKGEKAPEGKPADVISPSASINVNTASQEELEKIPGIGAELARRIVEYRSQYGIFATLDDLEKVKGIGAKKLKAIRKYITF